MSTATSSIAKVREGGPGTGYNAATEEYGDLVAQGVLDPVKVTRSALVNATSIAGMLLTTETLIVEKPEDEDEPAPRPATATATVTDPAQTNADPAGSFCRVSAVSGRFRGQAVGGGNTVRRLSGRAARSPCGGVTPGLTYGGTK